MNNVIFYHIYAINNWRRIVYDQLTSIVRSDLYKNADKLFCGIVGSDKEIKLALTFVSRAIRRLSQQSRCSTPNKLIFKTSTENSFEFITLQMLQDYSKKNDSRILYLHTKGVTSSVGSVSYDFKRDWRKCMEHFVITRWQKCIKYLDNHDVCGILYRDPRFRRRLSMCNPNKMDVLSWIKGEPILDKSYIVNKRRSSKIFRISYLAGNFWWTTTAHVRKLPDLKKLIDEKNRGYYEKWILQKIRTRVLSLYNNRSFLVGKRHPEHLYNMF